MTEPMTQHQVEKLRECPFCRGELPPVVTQDKNGHVVICTGCSALGPTRRTRAAAIEAWNERVPEALSTQPPTDKMREEIARHCASLKALSSWLLTNDLDMKCPEAVDVDPLDTIALLHSLLPIDRLSVPSGEVVELLREQHEAMGDVMKLRRLSSTPEQRHMAERAILVWRRVEALLAHPFMIAERGDPLAVAARELLAGMSSTYRARNGRERGIEAEDGEKCWIVHSDLIAALEGALAAPTSTPSPDMAEETGWLIEEDAGGIVHWIALAENKWPKVTIKTVRKHDDLEVAREDYLTPVLRVKDANEAIRFARKDDAEAFIKLFDRFLLHAKATEHEWLAAPTSTPSPDMAEVVEVLSALRSQLAGRGQAKAFAERLGISQAYLSDMKLGRREISQEVASALGFRRVVTWVSSAQPKQASPDMEVRARELLADQSFRRSRRASIMSGENDITGVVSIEEALKAIKAALSQSSLSAPVVGEGTENPA